MCHSLNNNALTVIAAVHYPSDMNRNGPELCYYDVALNVTVCMLLLTDFHMVKVVCWGRLVCHAQVYLFPILFDYKYFASLFIVSLASAHRSLWTAGPVFGWLSPVPGFWFLGRHYPALFCFSKHKQTRLIFPSYKKFPTSGVFGDHQGKSRVIIRWNLLRPI